MARIISIPVVVAFAALLARAQQADELSDPITVRAWLGSTTQPDVTDEEVEMLRKKLVDTVRESAASMNAEQLRFAIEQAMAAQQMAKALRELEAIKESLRALVDEYPGSIAAQQAEQMLQLHDRAPTVWQQPIQPVPAPYGLPQSVPIPSVKPPSVAPQLPPATHYDG